MWQTSDIAPIVGFNNHAAEFLAEGASILNVASRHFTLPPAAHAPVGEWIEYANIIKEAVDSALLVVNKANERCAEGLGIVQTR